MRAERKFQMAFSFVNHAKLWFSANRVPRTEDDSDAFYRRWNIIVFPNAFDGEKADPHLLSRLTTPEELSGILVWAVGGLRRLLRVGAFSNSSTVETIREEYTRLSDPVAAFVADPCEKDPTSDVRKDDMYAAYVKYCGERGLTKLAKNVFPRELPRVAPWVRAARHTIGGDRIPVWEGIRLEGGRDGEDGKDSSYFISTRIS